MSVNKVILLGNVGKDPDIRYPQQGQCMASFPLATSERYNTANGIAERTEWHNIVMWGRNAEIADKYVRKGTKLYIEGKLRTRQWQDRNAIKHYVTEVYADTFELLGSRPQAQAPGQAPTSTQPANTQEEKPPF